MQLHVKVHLCSYINKPPLCINMPANVNILNNFYGNLLCQISAQSVKQFTDTWKSIFIYSFSTLMWFNVLKNQNLLKVFEVFHIKCQQNLCKGSRNTC
jgi:hypothetical protein